ncbi:MAG: PAS domain S-box protein [Nitrospinae bacterium]|nr:PAS domain S-box protein [Nitrospinota bacterium]
MDEKELIKYDEIIGDLLLEYGGIIKKEEEKYRALFDNASDAIIIADTSDGRFIDVNKKAEELTGYSRKELIGLTPWDIHPMDGRERILKAFSEGIRTGHVTFIN